MPFKPKRAKTGGRQPGTVNKFTSTVKDTVLNAFKELQKDPQHNIVAFGKKYPKEFYLLSGKLIPTEVKQEITVPEGIKLQFLTDPGCQPIQHADKTDPGNSGVLGE